MALFFAANARMERWCVKSVESAASTAIIATAAETRRPPPGGASTACIIEDPCGSLESFPHVGSRRDAGFRRLTTVEAKARKPKSVERSGDDGSVRIDRERALRRLVENDNVTTQLERPCPRQPFAPTVAHARRPGEQRIPRATQPDETGRIEHQIVADRGHGYGTVERSEPSRVVGC